MSQITDWTPESVTNTANWEKEDPGGSAGTLLIEIGDKLLLENGNGLALE